MDRDAAGWHQGTWVLLVADTAAAELVQVRLLPLSDGGDAVGFPCLALHSARVVLAAAKHSQPAARSSSCATCPPRPATGSSARLPPFHQLCGARPPG